MNTYELNILKSSKQAQNAVKEIRKRLDSKAYEIKHRAVFKQCNTTDVYWVMFNIEKYVNILKSEGLSHKSICELINP